MYVNFTYKNIDKAFLHTALNCETKPYFLYKEEKMKLKKTIVQMLIITALTAAPALADDHLPAQSELQLRLTMINRTAAEDMSGYISRLTANFRITEQEATNYLVRENFTPGDLYMAAAISAETGKNIETVVNTRMENMDAGWGRTALELGIRPGSQEFHKLKGEIPGTPNANFMKNEPQGAQRGGGRGYGRMENPGIGGNMGNSGGRGGGAGGGGRGR